MQEKIKLQNLLFHIAHFLRSLPFSVLSIDNTDSNYDNIENGKC